MTLVPSTTPVLTRRLVVVLAIACGAAVANLYYAQPLLDDIAGSLGVSPGAAGLVITASQLGYATGLVLLVPLGDLLERRGLVMRMLVVCALALGATALAPTLPVLALTLGVVGVTSVVAQVLVPLASTLASDEDRGRAVGTVMSGLLIGILAARTVSGILGDVLGWRAVFAIAAGVMLALLALLQRTLPVSRPDRTGLTYGSLLASIITLVREEPLLRRRMLYGAMGMAGFSSLWTTLTFLLAGAPYHYGTATIGLFGLLGLAGAGAAQFAGRFADRGHLDAATGAFLACVLAGWGLLAFGESSLGAIIAGLILFDLGIQGQHISNQSAIYAALPHARSRVTTAYMGFNFLCGAAGSAAASAAFSSGGWTAVVILGAAFAAIALLAWVQSQVGRGSRMPA